MNSRLELKFSGDLVKKIGVPVLESVGNEATVFYSETGIRMIALDPEEIVTVVLRIYSISFSHFSCKRQDFARVDLGQLYHRNLKHARDEDLVSIHTEWQDQKIGFVFDDVVTGNTRMETEMGLIELKHEHIAICHKSLYKYKVAIAIRQTKLMGIFVVLDICSETDSIFITITDREVEFAVVDKKFVLSKEDGNYKVRGLVENDQVIFAISRRYCGLLWNTSLGSDIVYVCYSDGAPLLLQFPISGIDGDTRVYLKDK